MIDITSELNAPQEIIDITKTDKSIWNPPVVPALASKIAMDQELAQGTFSAGDVLKNISDGKYNKPSIAVLLKNKNIPEEQRTSLVHAVVNDLVKAKKININNGDSLPVDELATQYDHYQIQLKMRLVNVAESLRGLNTSVNPDVLLENGKASPDLFQAIQSFLVEAGFDPNEKDPKILAEEYRRYFQNNQSLKAELTTNLMQQKSEMEAHKIIEGITQRLNKELPQEWREQAAKLGEWIIELDAGKMPSDPAVKDFLYQLANSRGMVGSIEDNRDFLPTWLMKDFLNKNGVIFEQDVNKNKLITQAHLNAATAALKRYGNERGLRNYDYMSGQYVHFMPNSNKDRLPMSQLFKCYIEPSNIPKYIGDNKLPALFDPLDSLVLAGIAPSEMKTIADGGRVALYFRDSPLADYVKIKQIFNEKGISLRGPAQDIERVILDQKGNIILDPDGVSSNDIALDMMEYLDQDKPYNIEAFYIAYLKMCLKSGKDPSFPYKTSFLNFEPDRTIDSQLIPKISEYSKANFGYPIVYNPPGGKVNLF